MWNYNFVLPSLLMLGVILIYYFGRPRLPIRLNRVFLGVLIWDILTILTDYASSRADENHTLFSIATVNVLNMAYFICFLARIYWFFAFTAAAIKFSPGKRGWVNWLSALPFLAAEWIALSSFWTGALFTIDAAGFKGYEFVEHVALYSDDVKASNSFDNPDAIKPVKIEATKCENGEVSATLKKLSWNMFRFEKKA